VRPSWPLRARTSVHRGILLRAIDLGSNSQRPAQWCVVRRLLIHAKTYLHSEPCIFTRPTRALCGLNRLRALRSRILVATQRNQPPSRESPASDWRRCRTGGGVSQSAAARLPQAVAAKHYLQVTDAHIEEALRPTAHRTAQSEANRSEPKPTEEDSDLEKCCTVGSSSLESDEGIPPRGVEPRFSD
jgi:hypothetical protein